MVIRCFRVLSLLALLSSATLESSGPEAPPPNEESETSTDFLLCRHCGFNVAPATSVVNVKSPAAEGVFNETLFGRKDVIVQLLKNPLGLGFNVVTAVGGTCIGNKNWKTDHSWYPGYAWKVCSCSRCAKPVGWVFEPLSSAHDERLYASLKGFYTYALDNIISETYADSLLATPKVFSVS